MYKTYNAYDSIGNQLEKYFQVFSVQSMTYLCTLSSRSAPCTSKSHLSAGKKMSVKNEQKPRKLVRQNRENFIRAQLASISLPDFAVIKGIESPAAHQLVHDVTTYLSLNAIISIM